MSTEQIAVPEIVQGFLRDHGRLLIDGEWRDASDGGRFGTENPADGSTLLEVADATQQDVDAAVAAAAAALRGPWKQLPPAERGRLIGALADAVEADADLLVALEILDTGKPRYAAEGDVGLAIATLRYYAGAPARLRGEVGATAPDRHSYVRREPVGVAGLIVAWNFPLVLATWKLAPALAAGATVVLKPSEVTPLTALRLGELTQQVGIPDGVVNILTGDGTVGAALVEHPTVRKISFTGSTAVGKRIQELGARTAKRVTLELGGKSPNILMADADLEAAIPTAAVAAFVNSGQVCCSGNRLLVHRSILEPVLDGLKREAEAHKMGPGLDPDTTLGPLVSAKQRDSVARYLRSGKEAGYRVVTGGSTLDGEGYYVEPTVFADVANDTLLAQEEVFGPVLTVTAFDTTEEAIELANATSYGLAAAVWTRDLALGHRMAAQIEAGTVWINTFLEIDPAMPYGGFKDSGVGRDLGDAAVESYTELKTVVVAL